MFILFVELVMLSLKCSFLNFIHFPVFIECLHLCREEREKIIDSLETNSDGDGEDDDGITDEEQEVENKYQWKTLNKDYSDDGEYNIYNDNFLS